MSEVAGLGAHLAPDTINRLLSAACQRFASALVLADNGRRLASLYLYGYVAEQCLAAAYFRSVGHPPNAPIDADTRKRRMFLARQLGVMSNESHPSSVGRNTFNISGSSSEDCSPSMSNDLTRQFVEPKRSTDTGGPNCGIK